MNVFAFQQMSVTNVYVLFFFGRLSLLGSVKIKMLQYSSMIVSDTKWDLVSALGSHKKFSILLKKKKKPPEKTKIKFRKSSILTILFIDKIYFVCL